MIRYLAVAGNLKLRMFLAGCKIIVNGINVMTDADLSKCDGHRD